LRKKTGALGLPRSLNKKLDNARSLNHLRSILGVSRSKLRQGLMLIGGGLAKHARLSVWSKVVNA
jgi:hypothetical protein